MSYGYTFNSYNYQIRCADGTIGYVGQCKGKYVFTPLTFSEFQAAMLMAKALNKRTVNEHEIYTVKRRRKCNGRYGPMRRSAVAPVRGDKLALPTDDSESPPEVMEKKQYASNDAVDPNFNEMDAEERMRRARLEELARLMPEPEVDVEECY